MKEVIKKCLDGHIKDGKLDTFGALTLTFIITSLNSYICNEIKQVLKEMGVSNEKDRM